MAHERVTITINTEYLCIDNNRRGEWAKAMRLILNELAFEVGNGDWEFGRNGLTIPIRDPDGCDNVGTVEITVLA
jgi:hypothetical protein